jgi:tetratricopeptide (TPR) repeat protein
VLAVGAGWYVWRQATAPEPPAVALDGVDPEVAAAIEQARTAVRQAPRDGGAWGRLGMVLYAHGVHAEARACFTHAARLDPDEGKWGYLLALLLIGEDAPAAVRQLEAVADRCADTAPRLLLGELLLERGQLDDADGHFRRVLQAEPGSPRAHFGLARSAHRRGDLGQAREHLREAVRGAPQVRAVRALSAEVLHRLGEEEAAAAELRALEGLPEDHQWPDPYFDEVSALVVGVEGRVREARRLLAAGRSAEALSLLQRTARQYPTEHAPHMVLSQVWLSARNLPAAEAAMREVIRLKPDAANVHFDLGVLLEHSQRHTEAAECFRAVTRLQPHDAEAHFRLGQCLRQRRDAAGALEAYRAAVACDPGHAAGYKALGELLADLGKNAEAVAALENAVRLAPTDDQARELLEQVRKRLHSPGR